MAASTNDNVVLYYYYNNKTGKLGWTRQQAGSAPPAPNPNVTYVGGAVSAADVSANKAHPFPDTLDAYKKLNPDKPTTEAPSTGTVPENTINGQPIPTSATTPAQSSPSAADSTGGVQGQVPQGSSPTGPTTSTPVSSPSTPTTPTTPAPTGSGTVTTSPTGDFRGMDINKLSIPTLDSLSASAVTVNDFINTMNTKKAETYALSQKYEFNDRTNLSDVFASPAGTKFKMKDGSFVAREDLVTGNNFANVVTGLGSTGSQQLSQPLQNYKALIDAGVPTYQIAVKPLPNLTLTEQPLPDFSSLSNNLEGTQVGRGATSSIDTLQQMPNQSATDITGKSGQ